jgi:hypothetical protein
MTGLADTPKNSVTHLIGACQVRWLSDVQRSPGALTSATLA